MTTSLYEAGKKMESMQIQIPTDIRPRIRRPPKRDGYISWDIVDDALRDEPWSPFLGREVCSA